MTSPPSTATRRRRAPEVALLFSGGRDSALACALLALKGYRIHLLTFHNGATISRGLTEVRYRELKERFPRSIVAWRQIPSHGLFKKLALEPLEADFARFHTNLICMGCKLAMHVHSLIYCLEHRIRLVADGYTAYQKAWIEQMPPAIAAVRRFHQQYGIHYINPVYDINSKSEVKAKLFDMGLSPQPLEGACLFGGTFSLPDSKTVCAYIRRKLPECRQYIEQWRADRRRLQAARRRKKRR